MQPISNRMNFPLWLAFTLGISHGYALAPLPTQFVLDSWGIASGIPEETIFSIAQTKDGYLWLATANGLVQYDGSSFRFHQPRQNFGGAAKQEISRLGPGPRNSVWVYSSTYGLIRTNKVCFGALRTIPGPAV